MDIIFIKGLTLNTIVGIFEHERNHKQRLILDIEMAVGIAEAVVSEDITKTVDYKAVAEIVEAFVHEGAFLLVETMAEGIANLIMSDFSVSGVKLRVSKPDALSNADAVGVYIERGVLD